MGKERYELLERIGVGSFATVYRARDTELGREVAVKQIAENFMHSPDQMDRYWQEAQLLASLQHPNVVTFFRHRPRTRLAHHGADAGDAGKPGDS